MSPILLANELRRFCNVFNISGQTFKFSHQKAHFLAVFTFGAEIAAIILEPVAGNIGVVLPQSAYLQGLRNLCDKHGALLVFDEVMTGFRVERGAAQEYYNRHYTD